VAQKTHDQARLDAELSPAIGDGAAQAFDHGRERNSARGVALRVEEHLDVAHVVGMRALEIGPGEVVEILLRDQHRHALIIQIEKVLQVAETICLPHRFDRRVRQANAIAPRQREHQLRLEAAFHMDVQLAFGKLRDQGIDVVHLRYSRWIRRLSNAPHSNAMRETDGCTRSDSPSGRKPSPASRAWRARAVQQIRNQRQEDDNVCRPMQYPQWPAKAELAIVQ